MVYIVLDGFMRFLDASIGCFQVVLGALNVLDNCTRSVDIFKRV